jgi:CRP/FNR family transcriptional regulator, cyclic AMP receptor protein
MRFRLSNEEMAVLCAAGQARRYRPGERLFTEGDSADHVVVIRRGTVKVSSVSPQGYEAVLAVRSAGDLIGEFAALDRRPRSASVTAIDAVEGVLISGDRFRAFLRAHPHAMLGLLAEVISRLREADRRRLEFGAHDVAGRVSRLLLDLVDTFGPDTGADSGADTGRPVTIPLSQHDLAGATGASREAVSRALRRLRQSRAIATGRRRVVVLKTDELHRISAERSSETEASSRGDQ